MTGEKNRFTTTEKLWNLNDETLSTPEHDKLVMYLLQEQTIAELFGYGGADVKIESEVPILNSNSFLIGYWDIVIQNEDPLIDGYLNTNHKRIFIEVKPKIRSFGETLRQINTYKLYDCLIKIGGRTHRRLPQSTPNTNNVFLFTYDIRFKEAFESQGIHVIDANQEMRLRQ